MTYSYNRQGQQTTVTDQRGCQHAYDYDGLGRQIHDRVVTLGTGVVGGSLRLSTEYDSRGMVSTVATWNNATVGTGTILNQVQNVYNEFGQQTNSYQAHGGSVTVGTTPEVRYNYYHGGGNRIRMAGMTYPNGRSLTYDYGVADGMNDACSRIESIINDSDSLNLATYQYLGASGFVNVASAQPGINWTLYGTTNDPNTGDIYSGLDRFGRVDNCLWQKQVGLITTTLAQIQYGYDRASNRTWRKDGVLTLLLAGYDELYAYDGLYRLNDQKRGTLNGTQTAITSGTFEQQWGLDSTGNWKTFKQDNDGNGTWELNQTRTTNKANEITGITNSVGAAWATPTYDPAGNMAGIPNPQLLTAQYDAWNRLVSISDGANTVSQHVYDARGFRIRKDTYTSGTLTETRHYYYTPGWQCVEERTGTLTTVERQFVWGLRYIDDLVMRDRSTANNGVINERRYAMQDGNWNTIAICDITGFVSERFAYSAYGTPVFMTGSGVVQASSPIGFETLYAGYRWDGTTPQMYYVRNRFLLPTIGTWNRRDPLGYVDGMALYQYIGTINAVDWDGLKTREEWFGESVVQCAKKLCHGGFKFRTEDPSLPPGLGESVESIEGEMGIYTIKPSSSYCKVIDDFYADPSKYGTTCGRTSSLVLYCAIRDFYSKSGACNDGYIDRMTRIFELTPSKVLANNENTGLPLKETQTPTPGSFCIWVNTYSARVRSLSFASSNFLRACAMHANSVMPGVLPKSSYTA